MRVIDRLYQFLEQKSISPYSFERSCGVANGYLKKQFKGGGSIGSEILEKITTEYRELSLIWLITGKGKMFTEPQHANGLEMREDEKTYPPADLSTLTLLREKISTLEIIVADKEKIIRLLEQQLKGNPPDQGRIIAPSGL